MSTKAIEKTLWVCEQGGAPDALLLTDAKAELEAIRKAARAVTNEEPEASDMQHHDFYMRLRAHSMTHLRAIAKEAP